MQKQGQLAVLDSRDQQPVNEPSTDRQGYVFGVDIGRTHIGVYLADQKSEVNAEIIDSRNLNHCSTSEMGGEKCLNVIAQYIVELRGEHRVDWRLVLGIGIGLPGIHLKGKLISPTLMIKWSKIDIPTTLEKYLREKDQAIPEIPPMYLDNDANMGALGEARHRNESDLIFIKVGTGIGAGLFLNGNIYRGNNGAAGEFGHILLEPRSTRPCASCGKSGCLEALVGQNAIIEDARDRFWSHSPKTYQAGQGGSFLNKKFEDIEIDDLIDAANNGDKDCNDALKAAGTQIGKAIGSCLINILNPSLIVLEGAVIRGNGRFPSGNKPLLGALLASANTTAMVVAWPRISIDLAELGKKAIPYGTIVTVLEATRKLAQ